MSALETITVIVPIYNSETYLEQCLTSIINQTYPNLDILLVNDGSSDRSAMICEQYAQNDSRIRIFHKKLGGSGVGANRNTCLSLVTSDYLIFVDNDDWLEEDHVEKLYRKLKETDSDIAIANFTQYVQERQAYGFHVAPEDYYEAIYTPKEWFQFQYDGHFCLSQCFTVPWGKIYKRQVFDHVHYPENTKVEDDYTTWKTYLAAKKIVYFHEALYYHRKLETSVTKKVNPIHVFPLKSVEERITTLSLLGYPIERELSAYRYRLAIHKEHLLEEGDYQAYEEVLLKEKLLALRSHE